MDKITFYKHKDRDIYGFFDTITRRSLFTDGTLLLHMIWELYEVIDIEECFQYLLKQEILRLYNVITEYKNIQHTSCIDKIINESNAVTELKKGSQLLEEMTAAVIKHLHKNNE